MRKASSFEIPGVRVSLAYEAGVKVEQRPLVNAPEDVAPLFVQFIGDALDREHIVAALVDARWRVIGLTTIAVGTGVECMLRIADLFRPLILGGAVRYVLGHNHPSGGTSPSRYDLDLTRDLHEVGLRLRLELLDHLIIGLNGDYYSLRAHGDAVPVWAHAARTGDASLVTRMVRLRYANDRRPPRPSTTRADSLRAAAWECFLCGRRQTRRTPICRYCGTPRLGPVGPAERIADSADEPWTCPACGREHPGPEPKCRLCGITTPANDNDPPSKGEEPPPMSEPGDMAFVPLDTYQARWLRNRGDEPSQVLLTLLQAAMGGGGGTSLLPFDANQMEWLSAHGCYNHGAVLCDLVDREIRRETLKKAVAEEHHVRSVIRKHAGNLERQRKARRGAVPPGQARSVECQAERDLLPTFDQSQDPCMRHAALRYRFRFGINLDGTYTGASQDGTPELQRLREQRPGGWR